MDDGVLRQRPLVRSGRERGGWGRRIGAVRLLGLGVRIAGARAAGEIGHELAADGVTCADTSRAGDQVIREHPAEDSAAE